ncbi:hypothetical protein EZS27_013605 [termite gut metagenome]|uniref:Uncharacterized protein n=1 Tax=termite gut metagenome TaxID=433724 RepID=A0A5J4RZ43_9ZZZZ
MQKKNYKISIGGGLIFLSMLVLFSCIDSKYDLTKDIDLTVLVGGDDLTLPIGNTEKVYLRQFIKVEDTELLDTLTTGGRAGEYFIQKEDAISDIKVTVDDVEIKDPKFTIPHFEYDASGGSNINDFVDVQTDKGEPFEGTFEIKEKMPAEILEIKSFEIKREKDTDYYIKVEFYVEKEHLADDDVLDVSQLKVTFPSFIVFEEKQEDGIFILNNTYYVSQTPKTVFLNQGNNYNYLKKLRIKKYDFGDGKKIENGLLMIEGDIILGGQLGIKLPQGKKISLITNINADPNIFNIGSITGKMDPDLKINPTKIELSGLPDFLDDNDVRINLTNPKIRLNIANPFRLPIKVKLDMLGWKNGKEIPESNVKIDDIIVPSGPITTIIVLSKLKSPEAGTQNYVVKNLNDLFLIIPDRIDMKIEAKADQSEDHIITLGATEQVVKLDYAVNMPLSFEKGSCIVYKHTIKGWNNSLKDVNVKKVHLETEIESIIPLEFTASVNAIGVSGNVLTGLKVGIKDNETILPCKEDGSASVTTPLIIEIETEDSGNIIKEVDGVVLNLKAKSTETIHGQPLKSSQYLIIKKIKATVHGGVQVDMN